MFATHTAWGLNPRAAPVAPRARGGRRSAGLGASRSRLERDGCASLASRRAAVTASASRPSGSTPVPSGDGNVVPDAFRYASDRASKKHGTSLGAAQAAAGAVDPSSDPSQSVDPKKGIRVAYQGMPGAYSEAAALTAYPNCEPCPCEQFENAFEATEQWTADRAVLPFENSLGGSIHRNYDLILNHRLHIVGEVYFKVRHCLLALPGQDKADITRAMSHPQALAQCDGYLTALNGGVVKEAVDDTAGAAAHIKQNGLLGVAAVASSRRHQMHVSPGRQLTAAAAAARRHAGAALCRRAILHHLIAPPAVSPCLRSNLSVAARWLGTRWPSPMRDAGEEEEGTRDE